MSERNTVLEVKNLAIGYRTKGGTIPVSQNINFTLEEGKLVGLVGTNGIGKSTLLKTIIDMIPSLDGNILFKGVNSKELSIANLAKQISVVLTEPLATKNLTEISNRLAETFSPLISHIKIRKSSKSKISTHIISFCQS